jgi:monofunctional biosynthetic peptidoglycan transglycosylase
MRRVLLLLGLAAGGFVFWLFAVWPPPFWYRTHWPKETAFMAARPDSSAVHHSTRLYRPVPLDSIAPVLAEAAMIGEDQKFPTHDGIDYLSLAQALGYRRAELSLRDPKDRAALLAVLPHAWSRRDKLRGASTITQQLAKNLYLSASRNPLRKLKEAVIAWRLEHALGKRRIMELYLNIVELGDGVWGAEAASQLYFKRSAKVITRDEAAALAGTLPFPRSSNPGYRPGRMRWRQNLILRRLRGEQVEVPKVEEPDPQNETAPPATADSSVAGDSASSTESTDSTDSLAPSSEPEPPPIPGDSAL